MSSGKVLALAAATAVLSFWGWAIFRRQVMLLRSWVAGVTCGKKGEVVNKQENQSVLLTAEQLQSFITSGYVLPGALRDETESANEVDQMTENITVAAWSLVAGKLYDDLLNLLGIYPSLTFASFARFGFPTLLHSLVYVGAPSDVLRDVAAACPDFVLDLAQSCPTQTEQTEGKTALVVVSPVGLAVALRNSSAAHLPDAAFVALLPRFLKSARYVPFPAEKTALRDIVARILCPNWEQSSLNDLHTTQEGVHILAGNESSKTPTHMGRNVFNKRWRTTEKSTHPFRRALGLWVEEVVKPLLWLDTDSEENREVIFQREPTLRVQMPGQRSLGNSHIDYSYGRQPTEVNVWLPLSKVDATNTLWAESVPGEHDYSPFVADFGTAVFFYGNQCHHYSTSNTGEVTRVSLDFRVIRSDHFIAEYIAPDSRIGAKPHFLLGAAYTSTAIEREWRARNDSILGS